MRGERGFTLVEVLIALTLFATLMTLSLGGFRFSAMAWQSGTQAVDESEYIHAVRRILDDWVGGALIRLNSQDATAPVVMGFSGNEQSLMFATYRPPFPSQGGLYRIHIGLATSHDGMRTDLRARVALADQDFDDLWEPLAELPGVWRFAFFDAAASDAWAHSWDIQNHLPDVIRLAPQDASSSWPGFYSAPLAQVPFVCVMRALDPNRSDPATCQKL